MSATPDTGAPHGRLARLPALLAVLAAALGVRLWLWPQTSGLTMDSPLYVKLGEAMSRGDALPSPAHHGYSLLVALSSLALPGRELPGRAVSLVASLACVALAWGIARRHVRPALALAVAASLALHPLAAVYGVAVMTEATYLALLLLGLLWLARARPLAGGVVLGAGYWVRPEALVIAPLAALLQRSRRPALIALAGAAALIAAYLPVLRWQQGAWTLTPKSALLRPAAASYRTIEWRLRDSTTTVVTPAAPSQNLAAYAKSYPRQLRRHSQRLLEAWPLPWLALSLAGLWRARRATWLAPLALLLVYPLLDAPDEIRFSQFFVPTLALLAACGAETIADRGRWARALLAALALGGLVWVWAGPAGLRARKFDDGPMPELRGAGAWLRAHAPKDAIVMDRKSFVPFFAGLEHAQLPNDSLAAIADYARRSGASYLVAEEYVARALRPQLRELLTVPDSAEARYGLRLCYAARTKPGWGVAVFEVSK